MKRNHFNLSSISRLLLLILGCNMAMAESATELRGMEISAAKAELTVGGKPVHLHGVHFPPESGACGEAAGGCRARALAVLDQRIGNRHEVLCRVIAVAASGTHFVDCHIGDEEIGRWLVANGLALADRQMTRRYVRDEQVARRSGVGLWERYGSQFSMVR